MPGDHSALAFTSNGALPRQSKLKLAFRSRDLLVLIIATAYAAVLSSLPLFDFRDRGNYLTYVIASDAILQRYAEGGIVVLLSNEPIWLLINIALSSVFQPEDVLRIIIALPAFIVAWITLRSKPEHMLWLALCLLYPAVIKNHIIHLRQGVAIAIFLMGLFAAKWSWLRRSLIGITPLIHSSFFLTIGLLFLTHLSHRLRLAADLSVTLFTLATIVVVISVDSVASALGVRQAVEYDLRSGTVVSGVNFAFWGTMLVVMMLEGRSFFYRHRFEVAVIVFYLGTYFFLPITARVFESAFLLVLIAGLDLTHWRGHVLRAGVLTYGALQWALGYSLSLLV